MHAPTRITYIGHATTLIEVGGLRLLTDPILRGRVAHLRRRGPVIAREWLDRIDAVLLSHLHLDHLDLPSLRRLPRTTQLLVPRGAGATCADTASSRSRNSRPASWPTSATCRSRRHRRSTPASARRAARRPRRSAS